MIKVFNTDVIKKELLRHLLSEIQQGSILNIDDCSFKITGAQDYQDGKFVLGLIELKENKEIFLDFDC